MENITHNNIAQLKQIWTKAKELTFEKFQVGVNNALVFKHQLEQAKTSTSKNYYTKKLEKLNASNMKLLVKLQTLDSQLQRIEQQEQPEDVQAAQPSSEPASA